MGDKITLVKNKRERERENLLKEVEVGVEGVWRVVGDCCCECQNQRWG